MGVAAILQAIKKQAADPNKTPHIAAAAHSMAEMIMHLLAKITLEMIMLAHFLVIGYYGGRQGKQPIQEELNLIVNSECEVIHDDAIQTIIGILNRIRRYFELTQRTTY